MGPGSGIEVKMKAYLILEDGTVFEGISFGAKREIISEIVFNTSMTGYLEILTDPSYAGQAVCMTYPLIGNYGICLEDAESDRPGPDGYIVRELSRKESNFRSEGSLEAYLTKYDIPGIMGIDTRRLTKILREKGTMNGCITTAEYDDLSALLPRIKAYSPEKVVQKVSCREKYEVKGAREPEGRIKELKGAGLRVGILDVGMKRSIAKKLAARGVDVTVYPCDTKAEEILRDDPDGIMISNGPGDPKECTDIIKEVRKLYENGTPVFAICLGHQLMALAAGFDTFKLKYGHRGANHPVKDRESGRVYITSQNHGYAVDEDSVDPALAESAFVNVNDGTNEGLRYKGRDIFTVQFHPEACPGPVDTEFLFDRFIDEMKLHKGVRHAQEK